MNSRSLSACFKVTTNILNTVYGSKIVLILIVSVVDDTNNRHTLCLFYYILRSYYSGIEIIANISFCKVK